MTSLVQKKDRNLWGTIAVFQNIPASGGQGKKTICHVEQPDGLPGLFTVALVDVEVATGGDTGLPTGVLALALISFGSDGMNSGTISVDFNHGALICVPGSYVDVQANIVNATAGLISRRVGAFVTRGAYGRAGTPMRSVSSTAVAGGTDDQSVLPFADSVQIIPATSDPFSVLFLNSAGTTIYRVDIAGGEIMPFVPLVPQCRTIRIDNGVGLLDMLYTMIQKMAM